MMKGHNMFALLDASIFVAGFVACWFGKDTITKWFLGAKGFAIKLELKAAAIRAKL